MPINSLDDIKQGDPHGVVLLRWYPRNDRDQLHLGYNEIVIRPEGAKRGGMNPVDFRCGEEKAEALLRCEGVERKPGRSVPGQRKIAPPGPKDPKKARKRQLKRRAETKDASAE